MDKIKQDWTYNQFLAFLLLYCARADYSITDAEKKFIRSKTDNIDLKVIRDEFDKLPEYEIIQIILYFKEKYYNTPELRNKMYDDIKELFLADGNYTFNEENLFNAMKGLLDSIK